MIFLSTPSARRATPALYESCLTLDISIHALREEGDVDQLETLQMQLEISIHALREEGDSWASLMIPMLLEFLSTPSARRATRGR